MPLNITTQGLMFKTTIVVLLIAILASLGRGMFFLTKGGDTKNNVLNSLKLRVSLSIALVALLLFGYFMGWIEPNNVVITNKQK
tara:strand:- start:9 stop:260 length:252 start_codon:yes stop_codon:yes gene_type:complete